MSQSKLRDKIVQLSKELAECTDESRRKNLRLQIAKLKEYYEPTEPTKIGESIKIK